MGRKVTDTQRIINFGMGADEAALNQAIESLTAIRSNRYPKDKRQSRKPRSDTGKSRTRTQTSTAGSELSSANPETT